MLGDVEDDLEDLLEECGNQVDRPHMAREDEERPEREIRTGGTQQQNPEGIGRLVESINSLVQQNSELLRLGNDRQGTSRDMESQGKRKDREETNLHPQEPILLLEPSYRIEDDAHTVLDTHLRQKLRQINADPKDYWVKGAFSRVDRPVLGSSLYLEHLISCNVNEGTICKIYDRCAFWEIKNLLSRNSGVGREKKKLLKVLEVGSEDFSMGVQTNWAHATQVWEAMDALFNYVAIEFMIRPYNYSALAMLRCLHDIRYFAGSAPNAKMQRTLIEDFCNECFRVSLGFVYVLLMEMVWVWFGA